MLDQIINWFHVNAQFITAVIAILTPLLPTVIVKAINDKKLLEMLKGIRNTEDLKKLSSDLLNEKSRFITKSIRKNDKATKYW